MMRVAATARAATGPVAPFFESDLDVLQFALTLEHLENEAYKAINASGKPTVKSAADLKAIGKHEQGHVNALTAALTKAGATPVKARKSYNFGALGDLGTEDGLLTVARKVEELGVAAYNGAGIAIRDKSIPGVAGRIVQVEARHTGLLRALNNAAPAEALPQAMAPGDVLAAVAPALGPER